MTRWCVILCFCLVVVSTIRAQSQSATEKACTEEGATCNASYEPSSDKLIHRNSDGEITLRTETYPAGSAKYGYKIMRHVNKIQSNYPLREQLRRRDRNEQSRSETYDIQQLVYDVSTNLVEELLALALLHKEEWMQFALHQPQVMLESEEEEEEEEEDNLQQKEDEKYANDHFDKAINAYESVILIYSELFRLAMPEESPIISQYEKETISTGSASVHLVMADMFHQRYLSRPIDTDGNTSGDCSRAYRNLLVAESWCLQSESIMVSYLEENERGMREGKQEDADFEIAMNEMTQTLALTNLRLGTLLVDMYSAGYVLDLDGNLRLETVSFPMEDNHGNVLEPREGQKRMLAMALDSLSNAASLYAHQLEAEPGSQMVVIEDLRLSIADSFDYMGAVYMHLLQWTNAVEVLELCLSYYDQLFKEYRESGMVTESIEMAHSIIQTTQNLWETCLNLPGRTDDAKKYFRIHLTFRRYFLWQTPLAHPLADEEGVDYETSKILYQSYDTSMPNSFDQIEDTLNAYQTLLNDYLQQLNEHGPDGSYHEMAFDFDGINAASYVQHDKVYEGTLRSAIGSLQLAQNQAWEARGELELAVILLRDGDRDYFEADGENGEIIEYSVKLELAKALLNLAIAQLELKQYRRSFEAYEEAMELYESELADGETPFNHAGIAKKDSWAEKLTNFFTKGNDNKGPSEVYTPDPSINLQDYQAADNITGPGIGII